MMDSYGMQSMPPIPAYGDYGYEQQQSAPGVFQPMLQPLEYTTVPHTHRSMDNVPVYVPAPTAMPMPSAQNLPLVPLQAPRINGDTATVSQLHSAADPQTTFSSFRMQNLFIFVHVCVYMLVGILGFKYGENHTGWTFIDSLYFTMMTMSTVGYGDISPSNTGMRVFTLFMIFWGIIFIFPSIAAAIAPLSGPVQEKLQDWLEQQFPAKTIDIDGNGLPDYTIPRGRAPYYFKHLFPSFLLNVVLQLIFAGIFVAIETNWNYFDAVYHCLVTATTVGYGDQTIETQGGRAWASAHMAISVCLLGEMISRIDDARSSRRAELARHEQLRRRLDENLLHKLLDTAQELRPRVSHAEGLTELEFVLAMLLELEVVELSQLRPFVTQFRQLDVSGSGRLGAADLILARKFSPEQLARLRAEAGPSRALSASGKPSARSR